MSHCQGRVFSRLEQYEALPPNAKHEVETLEQFLLAHQHIFTMHHPMLIKSVVAVKYKDLVAKIDEHLSGGDTTGLLPITPECTSATELPTPVNLKRAVETLVLKGFVTPYKEDARPLDNNARESFEFKDADLFVPVSPALRGLIEPTVTVWDVARGAIYANVMKRKANLVEKMMHGDNVYVVVDLRSHSLTLFLDDVSREAIVQLKPVGDAHVSTNSTDLDHGVQVCNQVVTELLAPSTEHERDLFITALREIGFKMRDCGLGEPSTKDKVASQLTTEVGETVAGVNPRELDTTYPHKEVVDYCTSKTDARYEGEKVEVL